MCRRVQEALDSEEVNDADGLARSSSNISQMSEIAGKHLGCQNTRLCPYRSLVGAVQSITPTRCLQGLALALLTLAQLAVDALVMWSTPASRHVSTAGPAGVAVLSAHCSLGDCHLVQLRWVRAGPTHHIIPAAMSCCSCFTAVLCVCRPLN